MGDGKGREKSPVSCTVIRLPNHAYPNFERTIRQVPGQDAWLPSTGQLSRGTAPAPPRSKVSFCPRSDHELEAKTCTRVGEREGGWVGGGGGGGGVGPSTSLSADGAPSLSLSPRAGPLRSLSTMSCQVDARPSRMIWLGTTVLFDHRSTSTVVVTRDTDG